MMKALHFGAGNIGRGFIGLLLYKAGYEVVFADVVQGLVEQLQSTKSYRVITLDEKKEEESVTNFRAVELDSDDCRSEIVEADIITTAVGLGNINRVAGIIADGLYRRMQEKSGETLNVMACENAIRATSILKEAVLARVDEPLRTWILTYVGFADVSVDRIAPNRERHATQSLDAVVERFFEWDIEQSGLKGEVSIPGATFVKELDPFLKRKLFLLNGAHAAAAYAGFYKNFRTVLDAMQDEETESFVEAAQLESAVGLAHRYPTFTLDELKDYASRVRGRFLNPHIADDIHRVGRDPLRKLSANDRLVDALRLAGEAGAETPALITAIALGFRYNNPGDAEAVKIQEEIHSVGIETAVTRITGITEERVINAISNRYRALEFGSLMEENVHGTTS